MLTRLWQLIRPHHASYRPRLEPVVDTVAYVPPAPVHPVDPRPSAVSNHYSPLKRMLDPGSPQAAPFDAEMRPGDEVWSFFSPAEDWRAKGGRAGVALVRDGLVVRSVVTMLN